MANLAHIMHGNGHVGNLLRLGHLADANCSIRVHTNPLASNAPVEYAQEEELRLHRPSALVAEQVVRVVDGREKKQAITEKHQKRQGNKPAPPAQLLHHNSEAVRFLRESEIRRDGCHAHILLTCEAGNVRKG